MYPQNESKHPQEEGKGNDAMDDEILGEEERIYGEESEEEEEEEEEEEWIKYDIRRGPWAFLGDMFNSWFDRVEFTYAPLGKSQSMRFGHFHYYLPWEAEDSDERPERLREDREALELISLMLRVDPSSWFYTLKVCTLWFTGFDPLAFDHWELIPRVEIRMHQRFRPGDDHAGAAAQCRQFLLGGALAPDDQKRGNQAYHKAKARILALDRYRVLKGFKIPTQIHFQPPRFLARDGICEYLQDVVTLLSSMQSLKHKPQTEYTFELEHVEIILRAELIDHALDLLKMLVPLGAPITFNLSDFGLDKEPCGNRSYDDAICE